MHTTTPVRTAVLRSSLVAAAVALLLAACGGDDSSGSGTTRPDGESTAADATNAPGGDTAAPGETTGPEGTDVPDETDPPDTVASDGGGGDVDCTTLLSLDEVGAVFGETAVLLAEESQPNPALGQWICVWSTVEAADDATDLSSQLLQVQIYDGSTVPGPNFYAPDQIYPDAEPLDIGDEGYINVGDQMMAVDIGWLEGNQAGFMSWSGIDIGDATGLSVADHQDATVAAARLVVDRT